MPEHKHNLPYRADRLDLDITGPVLDSIIVYERSHGILHMPGEYNADRRPPSHQIKITSTDPANTSIYTEPRQLGDPGHYTQSYIIWNHRDSPISARIIQHDQTS